MSQLKPWIEDGAPEALARLIGAAREERPSSQSLARTLTAVGAGVIASTAAAAAGASLGSAGVSGVVTTHAPVLGVSALKWMLLGVGLGAAGVTTITQLRGSERPAQTSVTARARATAAAPAPAVGPVRARTERQRPASELRPAEPTVAEPPPSPSLSGASAPKGKAEMGLPASKVPPTAAARIDSERLAEEVRVIDAASTALANGRAAQVLTMLDDYDRRYPEPRFAPEALFLRMEALLRSARRGEAREIAEQLVSAYPKSPQSARARLLLAPSIP